MIMRSRLISAAMVLAAVFLSLATWAQVTPTVYATNFASAPATTTAPVQPPLISGNPPVFYIDATGKAQPVTPSYPLPTSFSTVGTVTTSIVLPSGLLGSATLSIPLATAVALPTAPTGATRCLVMPTQDVNWGNSTVASGTGQQYFFADIPGQGFLGYSSFTGFRLVGRTAVATATILWY